MKRILIVLLSAMIYTTSVSAQTIQDLLRNLPDSIFPTLSQNNVLDFMDYMVCNMKAEVTNKLGGKSEMLVLTDDYTKIRTSSNHEVQIKLLPFGSGKIAAVVRSAIIDSTKIDSQIEFYTSKWLHLPTEEHISFSDAENMCNMQMNEENTDLNIQFHNLFELDKEKKPRTPIKLEWDGNMWEEK